MGAMALTGKGFALLVLFEHGLMCLMAVAAFGQGFFRIDHGVRRLRVVNDLVVKPEDDADGLAIRLEGTHGSENGGVFNGSALNASCEFIRRHP